MQEGRIFPLGAVFSSSELHTCRGTDNEVARQTLVTLIFLLGPGTLQISILAPFSTEPRQVSHACWQAPRPHIFHCSCWKLLIATSPKTKQGRFSSTPLFFLAPHCLPTLAYYQTLLQRENSIRPKHFGKSSTIKCTIVSKYAQRQVVPWSKTRPRGIRKNRWELDGFLRILFTLYFLETLYPWHRPVLPPNPTLFLPFLSLSAIFKLYISPVNSYMIKIHWFG